MNQLPSIRRPEEYVKYCQSRGISRELLEQLLEKASNKDNWLWLQDITKRL